MQTILVVDDDRETVRLMRAYLENAGFQVFTAYDGESALHMLNRERPNLVVLDLMLPDRDGWDITHHIRSNAVLRHTPIVMLTARVEDNDKIVGLELGADDYVTKPFNPREVIARVRSVLRRTMSASVTDSNEVFEYDGLRLDTYEHEVRLHGQLIELTPVEFEVLRTLLSSPGHIFTRSEIIEHGLNFNYVGLERSLDTHIKNLRKKIEPDSSQPEYIHTIYGVGYRLGSRDS